MTKAVKIALIIALVLIVAGGSICSIAVRQGVDIEKMFRDGQFSIDMGTSVDSEFVGGQGYSSAESFELDAAQLRRIEIAWVSGAVELRSGDGDRISVSEKADRSLAGDEQLRWKLENGTLFIRYCSPGRTNMPSKELNILLPGDVRLQDVEIVTVSADTVIKGLRLEDKLSCVSVSGEILAEGISCSKLSAVSVSGGLKVYGYARSFSTVNVSGDTEAELSGVYHIETESASGELKLKLAELPKELDAETASGDVRLFLPENSEFELDYESGSGDLHCEFELRRGEHLPEINVETASGDLHILAY